MDISSDYYWITEGRLMAGSYPGDTDGAVASRRVGAFVDLGVTSFVDLTEEDEGLPPYAALLSDIAIERKRRLRHRRFAIQNLDVPTGLEMRRIIGAISSDLARREVVYIHCGDGVGRTGTVVGCLLAEAGVPADKVMGQVAALRESSATPTRVSPETPEQIDFVGLWSTDGPSILPKEELDRLPPDSPPEKPEPVPSVEQIVESLRRNEPIVIEGPGRGWCVQAIGSGDETFQVEVLNPAHWGNGPELPDSHQEFIESLGFQRFPEAWVAMVEGGDSPAHEAADLMLSVIGATWNKASES